MSTLFNYPRRQSSEDFMEYERSKESNCYGDHEEDDEEDVTKEQFDGEIVEVIEDEECQEPDCDHRQIAQDAYYCQDADCAEFQG